MQQKNSTFAILALYSAVGIQLATSVVAGLVFGDWLDTKLGTGHLLAIVGTLMGTIGGMWNMVRILKWNEKRGMDDK